jgi:hypothetical protein
MFLDMRSSKIFEYPLLREKVARIQAATKKKATRERYLGWMNFSEIMIKPAPMSTPILTTVPLKKGLMEAR